MKKATPPFHNRGGQSNNAQKSKIKLSNLYNKKEQCAQNQDMKWWIESNQNAWIHFIPENGEKRKISII